MNSVFTILMISVSMVQLAFSASRPAQPRLMLKVIRHQPCMRRASPSERIRFSDISKAPLVEDPDNGPGCYKLAGPVKVSQRVNGTIHVYVEAKTGSQTSIEKCTGADRDGCGGFGSCVYCDICAAAKVISQKTSGFVSVQDRGGKLNCTKGLETGNHDDIKMTFCMPTKSELQEAEDIDEEAWNANMEKGGGHMFFMTGFMFNEPINNWSTSELKKQAVDNGSKVIGCHRLVGMVYEKPA